MLFKKLHFVLDFKQNFHVLFGLYDEETFISTRCKTFVDAGGEEEKWFYLHITIIRVLSLDFILSLFLE